MKTQTYPSWDEEKLLWSKNRLVIGIDEVGRGAFAGPIVAAAVIYPYNFSFDKNSLLSQVNDSKKVKPNTRIALFSEIKKYALFWSLGEVGVNIINKKGIGEANKMVFRKVVADILKQAKIYDPNFNFHLLVDGFHVKFIREIGLSHQKAIIRGDQISFSIASASILAKVHRDGLMERQNKTYPRYGFSKNKGYGTKEHQTALKEFGMTKLHRNAFCKNFVDI